MCVGGGLVGVVVAFVWPVGAPFVRVTVQRRIFVAVDGFELFLKQVRTAHARLGREAVRKEQRRVEAVQRARDRVFPSRDDWWQHGVDRGWVQ